MLECQYEDCGTTMRSSDTVLVLAGLVDKGLDKGRMQIPKERTSQR
jgi:hypothetical protein